MRGLGPAVAAGAVIWISAFGAPATAQGSRCFEKGDIVAFDGVASAGASRSQWLLNLSRPIYVARGPSSRRIANVRIVGLPPPLGIPLELVGKLMLGRSAEQSEILAALVVRSGRRIRRTASIAPAPPAAFPHRSAPVARAAGKCDAPPYGGTPADYQAFVRRFGHIVKPEKILADVCSAKFGNSSRDQLHRLGLADGKIDSENTEQLAEDTILALKNLVNKLQ